MFTLREQQKLLNTMRAAEDVLLEQALETMAWPDGVRIDPEYFVESGGPDAKLNLDWAGKRYSLGVEVKRNIDRLSMADSAKSQLEHWGYLGNGLLVTTYLSPTLAEHCRQIGLQYLDTAGNVYINQPGLYINQVGKPKPPTITVKKASGSTVAKVGFILLAYPVLANTPYREIAKYARTSLGSVSNAIKTLEKAGTVTNTGGLLGKRLLVHYDKLLEFWTREYSEHLYPNRKARRFSAIDPAKFQRAQLEHINLTRYEARWGGETAAARLTHYLKPAIHTIYVENGMTNLVKGEMLKADPNGNIELVEMFWRDPVFPKSDCVPTILIFGDLMASGDPRNRETAELIRQTHLNASHS